MAKTSPPDFGTGGKLTVRSNVMGAAINISGGESIRGKVTANGPGQAVFSFGCQHRSLWSAPDFPGHPKKIYEWTHLKQVGDADAPSDTHALTVAFIGGITSYTFLLEKLGANGAVLVTLKDFDASSTAPADVFHSSITLFVV
jgi:hypothetical protein